MSPMIKYLLLYMSSWKFSAVCVSSVSEDNADIAQKEYASCSNGDCSTTDSSRLLKRVPRFSGGPYSIADVEVLIQQKEAREFLAQFNDSQGQVVEQRLLHCPFNSLCGFTLGLILNNHIPCCSECSCNYPQCMTIRACCPDIIPSEFFAVFEQQNDTENTGNTTGGSMESPRELIDEMYKVDGPQPLRCTLRHAKLGLNFETNSAMMYASCPEFTNNTIKMKCEHVYNNDNINGIDDMVPVTVGLDTYRNKYCAQCNNVHSSLKRWKPKLTYRHLDHFPAFNHESSFLEILFSVNNFDLSFVPPMDMYGAEPPVCKTVVKYCNMTGKWAVYDPVVEGKCALYANLYRILGVNYQNIFCAVCNGNLGQSVVCEINQGSEGEQYPFSGLLAFSPTVTEKLESKETWSDVCKNTDQVYDHIHVNMIMCVRIC